MLRFTITETKLNFTVINPLFNNLILVAHTLTKGLIRELDEKLSKGIILKPIKGTTL